MGHTEQMSVVAVLLAAGGGSRFAGPTHKLFAPLPATDHRPAEPVVARSLSAAVEAGVGPIVVVTGAVEVDEIVARAIAGVGGTAPEVTTARNERWNDGQMTSVRTGIEVAASMGAQRVVVGLADQPGITPEAWRKVAAADADALIAVATYDGRRGNPVALHSDIWHLLPDAGDEGARALMRLRPDLVVEVPCSGSSDDIDTEEDLRRWQNN